MCPVIHVILTTSRESFSVKFILHSSWYTPLVYVFCEPFFNVVFCVCSLLVFSSQRCCQISSDGVCGFFSLFNLLFIMYNIYLFTFVFKIYLFILVMCSVIYFQKREMLFLNLIYYPCFNWYRESRTRLFKTVDKLDNFCCSKVVH
jgi:hypothetical protein